MCKATLDLPSLFQTICYVMIHCFYAVRARLSLPSDLEGAFQVGQFLEDLPEVSKTEYKDLILVRPEDENWRKNKVKKNTAVQPPLRE